MTIIELNIAGYRVTHNGPDFRAFKASWRRHWSGLGRRARVREQGTPPRAA